MILCVFNFGYYDDEVGAAVANLMPYAIFFKDSREMTSWLRSQMQSIYDVSVDGGFQRTAMTVFMKVIIDYGEAYYEKEFTVRCKRVREYNIIVRNNQKKS